MFAKFPFNMRLRISCIIPDWFIWQCLGCISIQLYLRTCLQQYFSINESFDCRKTTLHEYCDFIRVTKKHFWLYFLRERFPLHVRRGHSPTTIHIFTSRTSCTGICFTPLTTSGIIFLGVVPSRRKSRSYFCSPHDKWNHFLTQIIDIGN